MSEARRGRMTVRLARFDRAIPARDLGFEDANRIVPAGRCPR